MNSRGFVWLFLKKLPIIMSVVIAPLTLYFVLQYNPAILRIFKSAEQELPEGFKKPQAQTEKGEAMQGPRPEGVTQLDPIDPADFMDGEGVEGAGRDGRLDAEDFPPPEEVWLPEELPPVLDMAQWEEEADACRTAEDFVRLAKRAETIPLKDMARRFYLEALHIDPENAAARYGVGDRPFDPEKQLEDFTDFEGCQLEVYLKPFREPKGRWLSRNQLADLRLEWETVRSGLLAELARREKDPNEDLRRRHLRRLMQHDDFQKMIREGDFIYDPSHPPFLVFIEGDGEVRDRIQGFVEGLYRDLDHLRDTFRSTYLNEWEGWSRKEEAYLVWILESKKEFEADFNRHEKMVILKRPAALNDYTLDEGQRRRIVEAFSWLVVGALKDPELDGEPEAWLRTGIPFLLSEGKGLGPGGLIRLNGEGVDDFPAFNNWLALDEGIWPIRLHELAAFPDTEELWDFCLTHDLARSQKEVKPTDLYQGGVAACALFCRYLLQRNNQAFRDYVSERLQGRETVEAVKSLLQGASFRTVEREIAKGLGSALPAHERERELDRETEAPSITDDLLPRDAGGALCSPEALLACIRPGMGEEGIRALLLHHVKRDGCWLAAHQLGPALEAAAISLADLELQELFDDLQAAAQLENSLYDRLAKAGAAFRLDGEDVTLLEAAEGWMTCAAGKGKEKILCPWTRLDTDRFIGLCKNTLDAKSTDDRLGYCNFYLLRNDGVSLRKEMKFITGRDVEKERLNEKLKAMSQGLACANLMDIITGVRTDWDLDMFKSLLGKVKSEYLRTTLKPLIRSFLEYAFLGNSAAAQESYLAARYKGYQGRDKDTGVAHFLYPFDDEEELADFDFKGHSVLDRLLKGKRPYSGKEEIRLIQGAMDCVGTTWAVLDPVFTGEMEAEIKFRLSDKDIPISGADPEVFSYLGYGLDGKEGYITAFNYLYLWFQTLRDGSWREVAGDQRSRAYEYNKTYTTRLEGHAHEVSLWFDRKKVLTVGEDGHRTGHLFLGVHAPLHFQIDRLEVKAALDPEWLKKIASRDVEKDIAQVLEGF